MVEVKSITIVGPVQHNHTPAHRALFRAIVEEKILTNAVNTTGVQQKIVLEVPNSGSTIEIYAFPSVKAVLPVTECVALYLPRTNILYEIAEQIVAKRFPLILFPPDCNENDEGLERRIKDYFLDNGFDEEQVLMNQCYLNGF